AHDDALQALVDTFGYADTSSATLLANQTTLEVIDPLLLTPAQADELAAINLALDNEQALSDATTAFDSANQAATDAETALADAEAAATDALAAAANKPIDDEVRNYVDTVLENDGILDYYRAP
ncbi:MAG: hypothetical protein NUV72_07980, partial [Bauldia sp.]|nr:hypothetical protein [Bauldia sp.]